MKLHVLVTNMSQSTKQMSNLGFALIIEGRLYLHFICMLFNSF